ncbi:MAG: vitamin K epoxide reductase family protein, partial [Bacteroidota bacterium]
MIEAVQRLYQHLFQVLHIPISPADLKWHCVRYQVEDFNFFKFIRDCAGWNIAHASVEANNLDHPDLPFPILIKKKEHHDYHLLLAKDKAGHFKTYDSTKDLEIQLTLSDILEDYETWALLLEATIHVPQKRSHWLFNPVQNAWLIPTLLLTAAGLFYSFQRPSISELMLFLMALAGIYLCWQLKIKPTSGKNSQWQQWCEKEDTKRSCDQVLKSDYSRLFNWIALADLGMAYFIYLGLFLILQKTIADGIYYPIWFSLINGVGLMIMLSLLAIQRFVIKHFCLLCLLVLGTVALINVTGFLGLKNQGWQSFDLIAISGVCAIAIVAYYSRAFYFFQISKRLGINHQNLLSNHEVFRSLLKSSPATLPKSPYSF